MSASRPGLRLAESASLTLAALNLAAAAWAGTSGSAVGLLKVPLLVSFGFVFVIALLIASGFARLARQLDPTPPTGGDLDGLQVRELRRLLRWAPVPHKVIGALGLLLLLVTLLVVGGVTWTTGSPFEHRHAIGIALYTSALHAIASPVLAALARLPSAPDDLARSFKANDT